MGAVVSRYTYWFRSSADAWAFFKALSAAE